MPSMEASTDELVGLQMKSAAQFTAEAVKAVLATDPGAVWTLHAIEVDKLGRTKPAPTTLDSLVADFNVATLCMSITNMGTLESHLYDYGDQVIRHAQLLQHTSAEASRQLPSRPDQTVEDWNRAKYGLLMGCMPELWMLALEPVAFADVLKLPRQAHMQALTTIFGFSPIDLAIPLGSRYEVEIVAPTQLVVEGTSRLTAVK